MKNKAHVTVLFFLLISSHLQGCNFSLFSLRLPSIFEGIFYCVGFYAIKDMLYRKIFRSTKRQAKFDVAKLEDIELLINNIVNNGELIESCELYEKVLKLQQEIRCLKSTEKQYHESQ